MSRPPELTSLIITSRIGFLLHNPVYRDPDRIDWVLQGITPGQVIELLTDQPDATIYRFFRINGFVDNPIWQSGYPFNFTWYNEEQDILYEHCTLPTERIIRGDVETVNQCRDFELLSDALSLEEYLEKKHGINGRKETASEHQSVEYALVLR